jgi:5'-methylthioadenosine phosphorylase
MRVGIISGSGTYDWPAIEGREQETRRTTYGEVTVTRGRVAAVEIVHLTRHGPGHLRLSNHVDHLANLAGLIDAGIDCLVSPTVCGSVDPSVTPGSLVVFDDLYFPSNRLPDGSICTWHGEPGQKERGHWIFDGPFSGDMRGVLLEGSDAIGLAPAIGCYGHVDGPRFNTRSEIAALAACGVTAVSQTAGPEVVLAGEIGLPMALVGYVTDFANGVSTVPEPVEALLQRMQESTEVFSALLTASLPRVDKPRPPGIVHRFG